MTCWKWVCESWKGSITAEGLALEFENKTQRPSHVPSSIVEEAVEARSELLPRRSSARQSFVEETPSTDEGEVLNLPPPLSDIPDDYDHDSDTGTMLSILGGAFMAEEGLKAWQEPDSKDADEGEGESRREKARRLVWQRGLPEALSRSWGVSVECFLVMLDELQEEGLLRVLCLGWL